MQARTRSVVAEPDELAAPLMFVYLVCVIGCLGAVLAWVFYYRGYS